MSNIPINLSGTLAADPQSRTLPTGRACASFRLAVNHWHLNRETGEFIDDGTSWFAVDCYGQLASNVSMSLKQGMTVMVQGGLRIREWTTEERSGRTPTVVAEHVGPDLRYGTANFQKSSGGARSQSQSPQQPKANSAWGGLADSPGSHPGATAEPPSSMTPEEMGDEPLSAGEPTEATGESPKPSEADPWTKATTERTQAEDGRTPPQAQSADGDGGDDPGRDADDAIARTTAAAAAPF